MILQIFNKETTCSKAHDTKRADKVFFKSF